jgi:hypothetical protein
MRNCHPNSIYETAIVTVTQSKTVASWPIVKYDFPSNGTLSCHVVLILHIVLQSHIDALVLAGC